MQRGDEPAVGRESKLLAGILVLLAIGLTVVLRVAPRLWPLPPEAVTLWNLMPIGALGLFAGARLRSWWAWLAPIAAMLISDLLLIKPLADIGQTAFTWETPIGYASYALYVVLGRALASQAWPVTAFGGAMAGSVQFFLVTNFAVWAGGDGNLYPHTPAGLLQCFVAALPFYRGTLVGDLLYSGLLFGVYHALVWALHRREASQVA